MTSLAFDFLASQPPSLVDTKSMAVLVSKRPETLANRLEVLSSNSNSRHPYGNACGEDEVSRSSSQAMMRELGDLIAPRQPAKVVYPLLANDLRRYAPDISDRRVRALYNGEVSRLWQDEALAIRMALSNRQNATASRAFARAAMDLTKALAGQGVPLSAEQRRVVADLTDGAVA